MSSPLSARLPARRMIFVNMAGVIALALTSIVLAPVAAAEAPLTLAQAQRLAIERSRALPAKDYAAIADRKSVV